MDMLSYLVLCKGESENLKILCLYGNISNIVKHDLDILHTDCLISLSISSFIMLLK